MSSALRTQFTLSDDELQVAGARIAVKQVETSSDQAAVQNIVQPGDARQ